MFFLQRDLEVGRPGGWFRSHALPVAGAQRMAYRLAGAAQGEPWLVLHGGPGSGAQPGLLAPFDLVRHRLVLPDQRGAGAGRPRAWLKGNQTDALVGDLERLRRHLGLARWSVLAGSWGTVLALAYAARFPQRVERLVLRGAFVPRASRIARVLGPGALLQRPTPARAGPAQRWGGWPLVWRRVQALLQNGSTSVASRRAVRNWRWTEAQAAARGMGRALRAAAARRVADAGSAQQGGGVASMPASPEAGLRPAWARLRRQLRRTLAHRDAPLWRREDRLDWVKFRIQAHYLARQGFQRPGQLDRAVADLAQAGVALDWVHGRFDAVCPPANGQDGHALAQSRRPASSRWWPTDAGHLGAEPANLACLRQVLATPKLAP